MLVTKREAKIVSKKALSLLLAVVMIMTSMSICFGTFTMAANIGSDFSGYTADAFEYLAEHLNGETVKKYTDKYNIGNTTNSGSANNTNNVTYVTDITVDTYEEYCELRDILIYLDKAVKATECYQVGTADTNDEQTKSCVSAGDVEAEILDGMGGYATPSAAAKEFLAYVLEDSKAVQHSAASTSNKSPAKHTATLNVFTTDYKGYLEAHEGGNYSTVDASIEMGFTYSMYMKGGLYYSVKTSCGSDSYYHNAIWVNDYPINAPSSISGKANTSVKTTLSNYASYVDNFIATNTFNAMAIKSASDIDILKNTLASKTTEIKNYIADAGEGNQDDLYDKLFPGYAAKISTFNKDADDAKAIAAYSGLASGIADYQTANPAYGTFNWGGFDEATIKADYATFTSTYASLLNNATVYKYFTEVANIFSADYVNNFRDNTVAYDLEDLKEEKIMPLYNRYALSFPMEGGEEISLAEKITAKSELSGYINNIRSYTAQVQNAIFPESLNAYLDLEEKFECQVADCVVYFAENVNKDYTDVNTEDVIKEVATAKSQLAALNALANSIDYAENRVLLDSAFANAETFINYLYNLLAVRYTAQVEIVDETYTAIGRPKSNLTISQYSKLNAYVNGIEQNIVEFLGAEGKSSLVTAETRAKYAAIETELMPAFRAFEADRGFTNFSAEDVLIRREDNADEFFRVNEDLDDDGMGEYEVTDENVENIVNLLDAALQDETVKKILGDLINKDADGNPTGEEFSLGALVNGLLEDVVYTDSLINTVMQFVYPLVLKEFAKVWAGLAPTITVHVPNVVGSLGADVKCGLGLDDVETAIQSVGLYIAPTTLAANLNKVYGDKYQAVEDVLSTITQKAKYDLATDSFRNPWENVGLFEDVIDETTGEPVLNDDGTVKRAYKLKWGVDEAEDKRAAFLDAAVAALSGLEPLLMALISNKYFENPDVTDGDVRGIKIGWGSGTATVTVITVKVEIDPITLTLTFEANDGWDNALVPIFEALGLTNIPHSEDLQTTRKLLENGLLAMIDQLVGRLNNDPVNFLLNALPNLAYMIEAGMIEPLLHEIKTVINYYADAYYDASLTTGNMLNAMKSEEPININIGEMINLKDMGLDISNFAAIWNMLSGVELLAGLEAPDAAFIASLGKLVAKPTNRSVRTYTATTSNGITLKDTEAWYIEADKAAVLEYLIQWVLESGLLNGIVKEPSELIATIFDNLENNSSDTIAAIVELLNQKAYPAKEYNWFDGTIDGESVVGNSANEIYLNPNNDWTKDKAEYLYNNIDALLNAVLTMAGADFDLGATISGLVDGLLTDKTLTSLAALLAKLDLNALLAGDDAEETPDANEPETVEEGEAAAPALDLDVNALVKEYLGLDLAAVAATYADIAAAVEADAEYVYDFGVDSGDKKFSAVLAEMLAPLSVVLDYLLDAGKLTLTIGSEKVELIGADGYNNAIVPLLEALGCTIETEGTSLEKTINALVARVDALAEGDVIKNIIDLLPGVLYFITSNGLSTAVMNLLQPVLTIVDTIRPVFDVMDLINGLEIGEADENGVKKTLADILGGELDLANLNFNFIFNLLNGLVGLDLSDLKYVIYDACASLETTYTSASALVGTGKKGAYNDNFDQADLLTVVLSFVLEWATNADNAAKLDEMLGTNGIIAGLNKVFEDVEITYGTPDWMYWFEGDEEAFNSYVDGEKLPNTLASIDWDNIGDNDWDYATAAYFAENINVLVDTIIAMIEINGTKYESLTALVADLTSGLVTAETVNDLVGMIADLLGDIDENLIDAAGLLLGVDLVGLKAYTCTAEINSISDFINELAVVLDTYAGGLVNFLFFGDDYRFAKKSDNTDTIVINGGLGYEKGLALILEALGCDLPEEATTITVLGALADRVDAILADPINEVLDLLPNLIYFLNANGLGVAVDNLLQPVYVLLDKLSGFGLNVNIADLLKFNVNGKEIAIDPANLSLANVVEVVETLTDLPLDAAEAILVDFATGKITKGEYIYKMSAAREDVITILLVVVLELVSDDAFAAKLDEMLGRDGLVANIKSIFAPSNIEYATPDWNYTTNNNGDYLIQYPNNWTEKTAEYVTDYITSAEFDKLIAGLIEDGKYASISALLTDKVNVFTTENLQTIVTLITDLLGGIDEQLLEVAGVVLDVDLVGLKGYTVPAGITTVDAFAAELANILSTYAKGAIEWLLLGRDFKLLVKDADGIGAELNGAPYITISGANGYAEGLGLLLEALGCKNLPATGTTEEIIAGVLGSLAARINEIFADPVNEVVDLLPNLIYFLNADGAAAVIKNTLAAVTALADKLSVFGINLNVADLVNLKSLMKIEDTDAAISLNNLSMAAVLEAVGLMVGIDLTYIVDVLVGFDLGAVADYDSVSANAAYKMGYDADFGKHDMVTILANLVIITVVDEDNAEFIKGLVGEEIYKLILSLINMDEADIQEFSWAFTDKADSDYVFSAFDDSKLFEEYNYGTSFTEERADYIADNFGDFVDNTIYLLGLDVDGDGKTERDLTSVINDLLGGSLYNSDMIIKIRDALAGVLANLTKLEVNGVVVGGLIADVLAAAEIADINAVANVEVPSFKSDRDQFVASLCDVLEPLYPVLKYLLANEDISFFVNADKTDAITLKGAEGYAYGIIPLLEALDCKNILTPAEYYAAIAAGDSDVLLTSILNPLLDRVDVIIANPADEILAILPNLIYFINSNGVDTVVKNTLNAVYTLLAAIEPIAKIDLYELIGLDLATLNFDKLFNMLLDLLAGMGYEFENLNADAIAELSIGKLESYTSANGKTAYRMVYAEGESGTQTEMVVTVEKLLVTFIMHETNRDVVTNLLKDKLGMSDDAAKYVDTILDIVAEYAVNTEDGMDSTLYLIYTIYYVADTGVGNAAGSMNDINGTWKDIVTVIKKNDSSAGAIIDEILGWEIFEDVLDAEDGFAPNGIIKFFQKIADWFKGISEWFKNLFSFGK